WSVPLLMDATVAQHDGYRFMYVLPFEPRRVLLEDTVYSGNSDLDRPQYERRIHDFATQAGARISRVVRREAGVLPLPSDDWFAAVPHPADEACALAVGYRGGFFHCVTGYSLPLAVRVAREIAAAATARQARAGVAAIRRQIKAQGRFGRLLNRLMFQGMPPESRWTSFQRFYRLPEPTIARFYASQSTWTDGARVLVGRPPPGIAWRHLAAAPFTRRPFADEAARQRKEAHQQ
ncbi:MAG: lycopene cyclase family protein, partial [Myxococcales bacterium]